MIFRYEGERRGEGDDDDDDIDDDEADGSVGEASDLD